jgi:hypothetical protein
VDDAYSGYRGYYGSYQGAGTGAVTVTDFTIKKISDKASPAVKRCCLRTGRF